MKKIRVFSDGSSLGNPGPGGYGAIVILPENKIFELGGREEKTTNNRMEMTAVIKALEFINTKNFFDLEIEFFTDSKYVIDGITKWVFGWQSNGWLTKNKSQVLNKDLWQMLLSLVSEKEIVWNYVEGHAGISANERVDEIASSFAGSKEVKLFSGEAKDYTVDFQNLKPLYDQNKKSLNKKAYSYVSMVDDKVEIHKTWSDCEKRVKGKKAKFKKTFSKKEQDDLIKEWVNS